MAIVEKVTYGFVSRTITNVLVTDDITTEKISVFSLYMHWAIIMAYPGTLEVKKQLIAEMLLKLAEQYPQESTEENRQRLSMLFADQKGTILEIYRNSSASAVVPALQWCKNWQQHCVTLFLDDNSQETCDQLFFVLKDSLALDATDQFTVIYLINETMRYDTAVH